MNKAIPIVNLYILLCVRAYWPLVQIPVRTCAEYLFEPNV